MVVQSKKEAVIKSKNNTQTLKILINKKIVSPSDISTSVKKPAALNLEENIGLKLFSWIGILALVIGVGYFIKYAIENNLIGYLTRIILGVVFGIILIIIGELFAKKEKYELWARTLAGGGFAITYFSVYAAYHFEEYRRAIGISQTLDIILLTIVVIFAITMSIINNSRITVIAAFFLGYITSLLSADFQLLTLIYSLLLTIGLIIISIIKKWADIGIGGVVATYIVYLFWYQRNPTDFFISTIFLLTYFFIYTIQTLLIKSEEDTYSEYYSIIINLINSAFFFLLYYFQIQDHYPNYDALFTLFLAVFYFALYFASKTISLEKLSMSSLYLGILYLTITIPLQLNNEMITIVWALDAIILTLLWINLEIKQLRFAAYALAGVTVLKTLFVDSWLRPFDFNNIMNSTRPLAYLVSIISLYFICWQLKRNQDKLGKEEEIISELYSWAAGFLTVMIIGLEMKTYWQNVFWPLFALILFLLGIQITNLQFRIQGYILSIWIILAILFGELFDQLERLFSRTNIYYDVHTYRLVTYLSAIIVFYFIFYWYNKNKDRLNQAELWILDSYSFAGTGLALILIALEMNEYWISIGWAVLALVISGIGFGLKKKLFRLQGLFILGMTILKVFLYDTRELETIYRTLSFIILGIILLSISFIYAKYKDQIKEVL